MNSKFYVSLEAEELLKEKGYPFVWGYDSIQPKKVTKAEAIDWLDRKGMYVEIHGIGRESNRRYCFTIFGQETGFGLESKYIYPTRLEAEEAAIIKALKLLL